MNQRCFLPKNKKSQAALEFLTTYGWAVLLIMVTIAAFVYFNVTNPKESLPERCNFGPEFQCMDFQISGTQDKLILSLKSVVPNPIIITGAEVQSDSNIPYSCTPQALPMDFARGAPVTFTFSGCNSQAAGLTAGKKAKIRIKLTYYDARSGSSFPHAVMGEIYGTVS